MLASGSYAQRHDVKTKLFWEFGKFNSRDGETLESYYSRFYNMMNKMVRNKLEVDTLQNKVNELGAERLAKTVNPLTLIASTQQQPTYHTQEPSPLPSPRQTTSTLSHAATRSKCKEIVRAPSPPHKPNHEEVSDEKETHRDKEIEQLLEPALNWTVHYYGREFRVLNCYDQKSLLVHQIKIP
ncbi:hypothetical protein Tco_1213428 [Tanacetum coccineum]